MNETIHIHDEAAAYALHALPPVEVAAVEGHAAQCPSCQKELDASVEATHLLALAVPAERPPARCKLGVMQRIEHDAFLHRPTQPASGRGLLSWAPLAAAMALLLVWNVSLQSDLSSSRKNVVALQATMQQGRAGAALVADAQSSHPLSPKSAVAAAAKAKVYMTNGTTSGVLMIKNLPAPPPGKVYQVWVANETEKQPCATFMTNGDMQQVMVESPRALDTYKWIMITLENTGGSTQPSQEMILLGNL